MIKTITSLYFDGNDNGIILDDAYDLYKRNQYAKYVKENSINYLRCQDVDMNLLTSFPNIEFVTMGYSYDALDRILEYTETAGSIGNICL